MDGWSIVATACCEIALIAVIARDRRDRKPLQHGESGGELVTDLPDDPPPMIQFRMPRSPDSLCVLRVLCGKSGSG